MVTEHDALEIIEMAQRNGISVWLDGGWGVDALLGRQTRKHRDIDLFIELRHGERCMELLREAGFAEVLYDYTTDSHRVWTDRRGRTVDLHLFERSSAGEVVFEGAAYPATVFDGVGRIGGKPISCIPPAEQVAFHTGYAHDGDDEHDVRLLCERFGIEVPEAYR